MAGRGSSKWQTERARREKAVAKKERRDQRAALPTDEVPPTEASQESQDDVLAALAALHESYADGDLSLDDFESSKEELVRQLRVE